MLQCICLPILTTMAYIKKCQRPVSPLETLSCPFVCVVRLPLEAKFLASLLNIVVLSAVVFPFGLSCFEGGRLQSLPICVNMPWLSWKTGMLLAKELMPAEAVQFTAQVSIGRWWYSQASIERWWYYLPLCRSLRQSDTVRGILSVVFWDWLHHDVTGRERKNATGSGAVKGPRGYSACVT